MFMGGRAFVFYFPVLDVFLQEFRLTEHGDDSKAAIIGSGIAAQFRWPTAWLLVPIHPAIRSLADFVFAHTEWLAAAPEKHRRIAGNWEPVDSALDLESS